MKVLLVDDHRELRNATHELLEILGYRVVEAASGEDALRAPIEDLELLMTDLSMPGIDGVELTERILAQRPDLAVLLASSDSENPRLRRRIDRGDVAFVAKPFSAAALREGIEAAITAKAVRRPDGGAAPGSNGAAPRQSDRRARAASPEPQRGDRGGAGARLPPLTAASLAALVVAATTLVLEPRPPTLPAPPTTITVRGNAIELLEPTGPIAELPAAFSWRPVAEADVYRLTVQGVDDRMVWEGDVPRQDPTGEPRLELTADLGGRLLPAVAYTWNVVALNVAGNRIAWSDRIRFRVIPRAGEVVIADSR